LLDAVKTLQSKSYDMMEGTILIAIDNKKVCIMIHSTFKISNQYNQDSIAKAMMTKELLDEVTISISIERVLGHKEIKESFQQNSRAHLLAVYD
jgi:hypothetical protein